MANIYPAMEFKMGNWTYYVVQMKMLDVASSIKFAHEVHDSHTLDDVIQRQLKTSRSRGGIRDFLVNRDDRFFSSIVVAALDGSPAYTEASFENLPDNAIFRNMNLDRNMGVLSFDGDQKYFALDGQHRVDAIKSILEPEDGENVHIPEGFENETLSVIIVVQGQEDRATFLERYRRLFTALNRNAKSMDAATSIIMDEDDCYAIATRDLISEHDFFSYSGDAEENPTLNTNATKSMRADAAEFSNLITLYEMNIQLLSAFYREITGGKGTAMYKTFIQLRPDEDFMQEMNSKLLDIWDSLFDELPVLTENPTTKRNHNAEESDGQDEDHLLFWPIGQALLADVASMLIKRKEAESKTQIKRAIRPLNQIPWSLHGAPWVHLLLTRTEDGEGWRMTNEDRADRLKIAKELILWMVGYLASDGDYEESLKERWCSYLYQNNDLEDEWWEQLKEIKDQING